MRGEARLGGMGEWVTAVIGLLGAVVGAGAAMWGAQRAARASQEALAVQVRKEDERWMRDQRQAAYHAMIRADMTITTVSRAVRGMGDERTGRLTPELDAMWKEARGEAYAAMSLIELCGPQLVLDAARELWFAGDGLVSASSMPTEPESDDLQSLTAVTRHLRAMTAFRGAVRGALGYGDSDNWAPTR